MKFSKKNKFNVNSFTMGELWYDCLKKLINFATYYITHVLHAIDIYKVMQLPSH